MKKALWWHKKGTHIICELCPHNCIIPEGKTGRCGVRQNINGELFSLIYGKISSLALDPIEKKPLYHFYPGEKILSIGTQGCNFSCQFCQNWEISQSNVELQPLPPTQLLEIAIQSNSIGVAYTYNEPMIWYEYIEDTSYMLKEKGLKVVLVTNGFINIQPLEKLIPYIDAANVDLKSMEPEFYKKICGGRLEPVLETIQYLYHKNIHIEITNLIIPGYNDTSSCVQKLASWIQENLSSTVPLHLSCYFPRYKFNVPPTPEEKVIELVEIAKESLAYVYPGNVAREVNTFCKNCGTLLIKRKGYYIEIYFEDNICPNCGSNIDIIR